MFYPALAIEGGDLEPNWMVAMSMTVPGDPVGIRGLDCGHPRPVDRHRQFPGGTSMGLGPYSVWDGGA